MSRHGPVKRNLLRMARCRGERQEAWLTRQRSITRYSFLSRTRSTNQRPRLAQSDQSHAGSARQETLNQRRRLLRTDPDQ